MINLLTDDFEKLKRNFDLMEGPGFFERSMRGVYANQSIFAALKRYSELFHEGELKHYPKDTYILIIYGVDGGHRYFFYSDGKVKFSMGHCRHENKSKARESDFDLVGS